MAVAQHLDLFAFERSPVQAMLALRERSGRWFDPQVVAAAESLHSRGALWSLCLPNSGQRLAHTESSAWSAVLDLAPARAARLSASHIDSICEAFAEVVDAKSHYTFSHCVGVTSVASAIGTQMGLNPERRRMLHRAALLHDLGKLRVPNSILDKPGKLDGAEWSIMQEHPALTIAILRRVKQFTELAYVAGAHHEKLDGSGYPNGLRAEELSLEARILAAADMYGALTEDRPYRGGYSHTQAMDILHGQGPGKLDANCLDALHSISGDVSQKACSHASPSNLASTAGGVHSPAT